MRRLHLSKTHILIIGILALGGVGAALLLLVTWSQKAEDDEPGVPIVLSVQLRNGPELSLVGVGHGTDGIAWDGRSVWGPGGTPLSRTAFQPVGSGIAYVFHVLVQPGDPDWGECLTASRIDGSTLSHQYEGRGTATFEKHRFSVHFPPGEGEDGFLLMFRPPGDGEVLTPISGESRSITMMGLAFQIEPQQESENAFLLSYDADPGPSTW